MDMLHPELMCLSAQNQSEALAQQLRCAQTLAIGPGLGQNAHAAHWLKFAMRLDARLALNPKAQKRTSRLSCRMKFHGALGS